MLLRHITEHVRAQNWFAVTLDFLIVVVGILIALQFSNWTAFASIGRNWRALRRGHGVSSTSLSAWVT